MGYFDRNRCDAMTKKGDRCNRHSWKVYRVKGGSFCVIHIDMLEAGEEVRIFETGELAEEYPLVSAGN